ncbi:MAG: peptidylprolyl isomerase [Candidatus Aegiribacteria sp.]|nr:peptidylprolyl isomerase [Candidatus Aegiribacteria sp.]
MRFIAYISLVLLIPAVASAEVIASVDDATLTWDDVISMIGGEQNVQYLGITTEASAIEVLESWVREEIMVQAALNSGLESNPEVIEFIEQARRQILLEAYMADIVEGLQPSQLEIENYVDVWLNTYRNSAHIRHIIVQDENLANSLLARINAGSDFAALAQEYSIGPSAVDGGDLGWIMRGQSGYMSFDEAAFRLGEGEVSDVVETGAGYHIIKAVETQLLSPEPVVEEIQQMVSMELMQAMQEEAIMSEIEALEMNHNIVLYPERLLEHF